MCGDINFKRQCDTSIAMEYFKGLTLEKIGDDVELKD
jgi:hypothetical protein